MKATIGRPICAAVLFHVDVIKPRAAAKSLGRTEMCCSSYIARCQTLSLASEIAEDIVEAVPWFQPPIPPPNSPPPPSSPPNTSPPSPPCLPSNPPPPKFSTGARLRCASRRNPSRQVRLQPPQLPDLSQEPVQEPDGRGKESALQGMCLPISLRLRGRCAKVEHFELPACSCWIWFCVIHPFLMEALLRVSFPRPVSATQERLFEEVNAAEGLFWSPGRRESRGTIASGLGLESGFRFLTTPKVGPLKPSA